MDHLAVLPVDAYAECAAPDRAALRLGYFLPVLFEGFPELFFKFFPSTIEMG